MSSESTVSKGSAVKPAAAGPAAPGDGGRQPATIRYLDRADMVETFADSITGLIFDGQTLRIEFGVTRFDDVKPNTADHRPSLSRLPPGAAAGRGGGSHQPHAADRGGADASRRGQADAAAGAEAPKAG